MSFVRIPHAKFGYNLVRMDRVKKHPPWWPSLCGTLHGTCQNLSHAFWILVRFQNQRTRKVKTCQGCAFLTFKPSSPGLPSGFPSDLGSWSQSAASNGKTVTWESKVFLDFCWAHNPTRSILGMRHIPCHRLSWKLHNPLLNTEIVKESMAKKKLWSLPSVFNPKNIWFTRCVSTCEQVLHCAFRRVAHPGVQWKSAEGIQIVTGVYTPNAPSNYHIHVP